MKFVNWIIVTTTSIPSDDKQRPQIIHREGSFFRRHHCIHTHTLTSTVKFRTTTQRKTKHNTNNQHGNYKKNIKVKETGNSKNWRVISKEAKEMS